MNVKEQFTFRNTIIAGFALSLLAIGVVCLFPPTLIPSLAACVLLGLAFGCVVLSGMVSE